MNILVINGASPYGHSGGLLNRALMGVSIDFFSHREGCVEQHTDINESYSVDVEVAKLVWADLVIYHVPVWWFQVPFTFKEYLDRVFSAGKDKGMFTGDGRSRSDLSKKYGTGGTMQGTRYILTTTWNAPEEAFTDPDQFFKGRSVDETAMAGFHLMHCFVGMEHWSSYHFYDVMKNPNLELDLNNYQLFLSKLELS